MAALTCDEVGLSTEELERASYVRLDDGTFALRIVVVTGGDALDCDNNQDSTETMRRGAFVSLGSGQWAVQVIDET